MDTDISARRLVLAAGLEVFDEGADLILASPAGMLRLSGGVADLVRQRLLPALASEPERAALLGALGAAPASEVSRLVDRLIEAGMVSERGAQPVPEWLSLVSTDAATRDALAARLAAVRVLVIAGEADAAGLAALAGDAGIGSVERTPPDGLTAADLAELVAGRDLVICAVDPGWAAVRTWLNRACLAVGVPALYVAFEGSYATLGPLVLPGRVRVTCAGGCAHWPVRTISRWRWPARSRWTPPGRRCAVRCCPGCARLPGRSSSAKCWR